MSPDFPLTYRILMESIWLYMPKYWPIFHDITTRRMQTMPLPVDTESRWTEKMPAVRGSYQTTLQTTGQHRGYRMRKEPPGNPPVPIQNKGLDTRIYDSSGNKSVVAITTTFDTVKSSSYLETSVGWNDHRTAHCHQHYSHMPDFEQCRDFWGTG